MKGIHYKKAAYITIFLLLTTIIIFPNITGITKTDKNPVPLNSDDWWTMPRHDAANTGCSTTEAPNTNQLNWYFDTHEGVGLSSAAIVEDNVLVVTGSYYDKDLFKNVTKILTPSEKTEIIDYIKNKVSNINEQQYGSIFCLDAENGSIKWARQLFLPTDPVVHDNKVYVSTIDLYSYSSYIYCLDLDTGNMIWQQPVSGWILSSMIIYESKLYVGVVDLFSYTGSIYCIDSASGSTIWTRNFGVYEFLLYGSPAAANGKVFAVPWNFFTYYTSTLYCLDATTGNYIWTKTLYGIPYNVLVHI